jgi:hypothetical protein
MTYSAVPKSIQRITVRLFAAVVLVIVVGVLFGGAHATAHRHDGPGFYDASCPLAALGAVDRNGGGVPLTASTPLAMAISLVAIALVGGPVLTPAADARLRAPPAR